MWAIYFSGDIEKSLPHLFQRPPYYLKPESQAILLEDYMNLAICKFHGGSQQRRFFMVQSLAGPMPFTCRECKSEFLEADRSNDPVLAREDTCNRHRCKTIKNGDCHGGWYKFFPDGGLYSINYLCDYCETKILFNSLRASGLLRDDQPKPSPVKNAAWGITKEDDFSTSKSVGISPVETHKEYHKDWEKWFRSLGVGKLYRHYTVRESKSPWMETADGQDISSANFGMITGRGLACIDCLNNEGEGATSLQHRPGNEEEISQQRNDRRKRYGGNS